MTAQTQPEQAQTQPDHASAPRPPEQITEAFKRAFRAHPAGVAIITAQTPAGPVGLTVSSVASVSADPPALSFSVSRATGSAAGIIGAPSFAVNLLAAHHAGIAETFARSGTERFTPAQGWATLPTGEPVLPDAPAVLRCRLLDRIGVGASTLVLAEVLDAVLVLQDSALAYHDRRFLPVAVEDPAG